MDKAMASFEIPEPQKRTEGKNKMAKAKKLVYAGYNFDASLKSFQ